MTLHKYANVRMVVLDPGATVLSAVRALQDNRVGSIVVHDGSSVVGIVTDRDLALRALSRRLDPSRAPLSAVMTADVAVLPVAATELDAARLMIERRVRRIPLVEGARVVGLLTLDDLVLERALTRETLAEIVRAQLAQPARHKDEGRIRPSSPAHPRSRPPKSRGKSTRG